MLIKDRTLATELKEALDAKRSEAASRWKAFETARKEAIEAGDAAETETLVRLDELHKAYDVVASECGQLENRLVRHLGIKASVTPDGRDGRLGGIGSAFLKTLGGAELKALTTGGSTVPAFFDPRIRDLPQRQLFVRTLLPTLQAEGDTVTFLRQTVATNGAAPVAAGGLKPTSTYTVEKVEQPVRVIAHVTEALDRSLLADQDALVDFLDQQLRLGVLLSEEQQIISGSGVAPNLRGILNTTGVLTVARDTANNEPRTDAIYRAITAVRQAFFEPDGIVLNPADWQDIRLQKDANENYQTGDPIADDSTTLFGKQVITSPVVTAGTGIVGAFAAGATVWEREGSRVTFAETGLGDAAGEELFTRNLVRFRAEERIAFGVERPAAFCSVTAL